MPERLGYVDPHLVLTKDREDPVHYRMDFDGQTPGVNHFVFQLAPTTSGLYFYHFDLYTDFRKIYRTANGEGELTWVNGLDWQLTVYEPDFKTPDWIKDGTMYQIFPDRFYEGVPNKPLPFADRIYRPDKTGEPYFWPNEQSDGYLNMDYYGGDFAGIQQKLPYLEELGVTCIYLNPIFEAHANHRYNTANYLKADPLLGTNKDFAALCAEAKKHGIRIILDGVFSHTGSDSLYFNREGRYGPGGAYRDRNSPYRSWYDFDSGYVGGYRSWWGFETLPEVEEEDPSYGNFVCGKGGVIDTWLGLGASGFRLDVADELPDDFIEKIRAAVKAHGEDKLLIGEVWEDATTKEAFDHRRTYLRGHGLDATMNYPFRNAAVAFARGEDASAVGEQIMSICENYPKPALDCAMNFLSTHDTERGITAIAGEPANGRDRYWQSKRMIPGDRIDDALRRVLLAYAMLYTLPGVPCVYYGDEIGMRYLPLPTKEGGYFRTGSRTPMQWDNSANKGFSTAAADKLYLPVDDAADAPTVAAQQADPDSLWHTVQGVLNFRHSHRDLDSDAPFHVRFAPKAKGSYRPFAWERGKLICAVNPAREEAELPLKLEDGTRVLHVIGKAEVKGDELVLGAQSFAILG